MESKLGIRKTNLTPTDVKGDFDAITTPVINNKYHISWAFSGAVFKLVKVEGDVCYLDNPKYKRNFTLDTLTYWMLAHLSIKLTIEQFVALMNIAGGWSEICKVNPRLEPNALGTFMHLCDMYSSQMLGKYKEE